MLNCFNFVPQGAENCEVQAYLQESWHSPSIASRKLPSIIVCPGGGYSNVSFRENFPVAREFIAAGYHVFVLTYSVKEDAKNFQPLCQLAATISHIRNHCEEWMAETEQIAVIGFSAGGHLAASSGTLAQTEKFREAWKGDENILPNAMILGYPVILANEYAHIGSIKNVSGSEKDTETYQYFGLDRHVTKNTPPTFLFHTAADAGVSVENSLQFASALRKEGVPFELHVLPHGPHGVSVCTKEVGSLNPYNGRWVAWAIDWLNQLFQFEK